MAETALGSEIRQIGDIAAPAPGTWHLEGWGRPTTGGAAEKYFSRDVVVSTPSADAATGIGPGPLSSGPITGAQRWHAETG